MTRVAFVPPTISQWHDSWSESAAIKDRLAYVQGCAVFDSVLAKYLPAVDAGDALEIGCYPGGFLHYLGRRFGYRVSGFDSMPETDDLGSILADEGLDVGRLWSGSIETEPPEPIYDLVCSFGFIEHFEHPQEVIRQHAAWLRPGGLLVITMPHFRRGQWMLHRAFDDSSLRTHNTSTMSLRGLREGMQSAHIDPVAVQRFGTCDFWYEPDPNRSRTRTRLADLAVQTFGKASNLGRRTLGPQGMPNPLLSPFIVGIGRKPQ